MLASVLDAIVQRVGSSGDAEAEARLTHFLLGHAIKGTDYVFPDSFGDPICDGDDNHHGGNQHSGDRGMDDREVDARHLRGRAEDHEGNGEYSDEEEGRNDEEKKDFGYQRLSGFPSAALFPDPLLAVGRFVPVAVVGHDMWPAEDPSGALHLAAQQRQHQRQEQGHGQPHSSHIHSTNTHGGDTRGVSSLAVEGATKPPSATKRERDPAATAADDGEHDTKHESRKQRTRKRGRKKNKTKQSNGAGASGSGGGGPIAGSSWGGGGPEEASTRSGGLLSTLAQSFKIILTAAAGPDMTSLSREATRAVITMVQRGQASKRLREEEEGNDEDIDGMGVFRHPPRVLIVVSLSATSIAAGAAASASGGGAAAAQRFSAAASHAAVAAVAAAESAAAVGRAVSEAHQHHRRSHAPFVAVVLVFSPDVAAVMPVVLEALHRRCRGAIARRFAAAHYQGGAGEAVTGRGAGADEPIAPALPVPVARLLLEVIPLVPLFLDAAGLLCVVRAYHAAMRLRDAATALQNLLAPLSTLDHWRAGQQCGSAAEAPDVSSSSSAALSAAMSPAVADLVDIFLGHAVVVAAREGPVAAAVSFGTLYSAVCRGDWAAIRRVTLRGRDRLVVAGAAIADEFQPQIIYHDAAHVLRAFAHRPLAFPTLACPAVSLGPELAGHLLVAVGILVEGGGNKKKSKRKAVRNKSVDQQDGIDKEEKEKEGATAADSDAIGASTDRGASMRDATAAMALGVGVRLNPLFFSPGLSDASRILYILLSFELRAAGLAVGAWTPLRLLATFACFGDHLRLMRGLHHLSLSRLVTVNAAKGVARSHWL